MPEIDFYILFFCLSVASILAAIAAGIVIHKRTRKADQIQKRSAVTPFQAFLIGFFVAAVVMFYPVYATARFAADNGFVCFVKSLLMSVLNTLQIFFLNGDFSAIGDSVASVIGGGFGTGYTIYSNVLHVIAPVLTFGFILSFFRETISMLKYMFRPFTDIYVMSELSESSLALAKDILNNAEGKKQVVFTDVFEKNDEAVFELVTEAKRLGAICLKKDITELGLKRAKITRKLFFISRNEDANLNQALTIINRLKDTRYDNKDTMFYVFASSTESETLLDAVEHGNMKVRRINERINLILQTLQEHSVFEGAIEDENGVKHINAAIVGLGTYGTALLKTLCWLCQMPKYKLTVHAFEYGNGENKIKSVAPELYKHNGEDTVGEPYYNIIFHNDTDVKSSKFTDEIAKLKDLTVAFVTLGTDEQNIETAMTLRMVLARNVDDNAPAFPPIYTVVYSALKNEIVRRNGGLKAIPDLRRDPDKPTEFIPRYNNDYGIEFIGDISTRFSLKVIEQVKLEDDGLKCHMAWSEYGIAKAKEKLAQAQSDADKAVAERDLAFAYEDAETNRRKYERYEYFRASSIAESAHKKYMLELCPEMFPNGNANAEASMYEHNRWNAYTRSQGYVLPDGSPVPKRKNHVAKLHYDLVSHFDLDEHEKIKDTIVKSK